MSMRGRPVDHTGSRFGRLTVLYEGPRNNSNRKTWVCRCDCGSIKTAAAFTLVCGGCTSWGCYQRETTSERFATHRLVGTLEHRIWNGMLTRCRNPNATEFHNYGGRGITVCDRWTRSFENFFNDMGSIPSGKHSIDRYPDKNGNYEPGNCRWATSKEQGRNTRRNRTIWFKGKDRLLVEICEMTGIRHATIRYRAARNLPLDSAPYTNRRVRS